MTASTTTEPIAPRRASTNRRIWTVIAVVVGGVVVVNLAAQGLDRAVGGSQPGGVAGSSYATAPQGLAAFGSLLSGYGYPVTQQRGPIADNPPPENATAFVLEPDALTADDSTALLQFVTGGGRLIVGGSSPFYLHGLTDQPPEWQPVGTTSWTTVDPTLGDVHDVEAAGTGSWAAQGRGTVVVGSERASLVTRDRVGRGEIYFLADASPLENAYLGDGDNAAFALGLAGGPVHPVVFAEGVHGYGANRGIAAIPDRWKIALVLVGFAALAFVWSRARRFGPPDRTSRELPPARATYVDALSINLERTRDPAGAFAPAQRWAQDRIARRAGLGADPDDQILADTARGYGCTDAEVEALFAPATDDARVLALGRAVARVGADRRMQ